MTSEQNVKELQDEESIADYWWVEWIVSALLVSVILYLLKQIVFGNNGQQSTNQRVVFVPKPKPEPRDFTVEELRKYDGATPGTPIYIGVKGKVYDVSSRAEFYGVGGPYHAFAGRDASRALALGSTDEADANNPSLEGLAWAELDALNDWAQTFAMKYDQVGSVIPPIPIAGPSASSSLLSNNEQNNNEQDNNIQDDNDQDNNDQDDNKKVN